MRNLAYWYNSARATWRICRYICGAGAEIYPVTSHYVLLGLSPIHPGREWKSLLIVLASETLSIGHRSLGHQCRLVDLGPIPTLQGFQVHPIVAKQNGSPLDSALPLSNLHLTVSQCKERPVHKPRQRGHLSTQGRGVHHRKGAFMRDVTICWFLRFIGPSVLPYVCSAVCKITRGTSPSHAATDGQVRCR